MCVTLLVPAVECLPQVLVQFCASRENSMDWVSLQGLLSGNTAGLWMPLWMSHQFTLYKLVSTYWPRHWGPEEGPIKLNYE